MIYSFCLFDQTGQCLYYQEWNRKRSVTDDELEEQHKLTFGMLFSLNKFCQSISPVGGCQGINSFRTKNYKLHYLETATCLKLVLTTDPNVGDLKEQLKSIYRDVYVECVSRNPLHQRGEAITSKAFTQALEKCVKGIACFN